MSRKLATLAAIAVAGVCSWSQAGIVATVTPVTTSVPTGFTGYKITLATDDGGVLGGVDFSAAGRAGKAFNLTLHQRWTAVVDQDTGDTTNPPTPVGTSVVGNDSHLVYNVANVLVGTAASEDNTGLGSPMSGGGNIYGLGSTLSGAWAYKAGLGTSSMDVAYMVIKNGTLPVNGILAIPDVTEVRGGNVIAAIPVTIAVPEPSSIGLLGVGVIGLASRRRKA